MDIRQIEPRKLLYYSLPFVGIYVTIVILHYSAAHAYAWHCTRQDGTDFLFPRLLSRPHCRALRWSVQQFAADIESMWTNLGKWMVTNVVVANMVDHMPIHF
jgi:hypothetical protein